MDIQIAEGRPARQFKIYSRKEMVLRVLWMAGQFLVRFSPRPFYGWRRFVLRRFGAQLGEQVNIQNSTEISMPWRVSIGDYSSVGEYAHLYSGGYITIGARATISLHAHLLAGSHDFEAADFTPLTPPIVIGDDAWICADARVGPNVVIGDGAVVGAGAVVFKDVEPWTVVSGNPAKVVKVRVIKRETHGPPLWAADPRVPNSQAPSA